MLRVSLIVASVLLSVLCRPTDCVGADASSGEVSALELFERRIMPIFRSPEPSSCVQCHLASVDLKEYILPSHEKTFVSLRDQGLIDLGDPEKSKILQLIRMGEKDLDEGARLIHQETREAEYEAFAAWIIACCNDSRLRELPPLSADERARPEKPDAVIRHARKSRVVDSFVRNVWSQRMRCFPCHTPFEIDETNPRHQAAIKTRRELAEQYPELVSRLDIFEETPEATLQAFIERSRHTPSGHFPLINLQEPRKSLLVLKPMSKLPAKDENGRFHPPSSVEPISHMGGLKMHPNDQSYKSIVTWIQDYAKVVGSRYTSVAQLPADNWHATQLVLRLTSAPEEWPVGTPVQLFVYARDDEADSWGPEPIAFTQGTVTPQRMVNGALFLLAPTLGNATDGDQTPASLPRGRYLVKTYADLNGRIADDPTLLLGEEDFAGQAEIERARWREGFRAAESIPGSKLLPGSHH